MSKLSGVHENRQLAKRQIAKAQRELIRLRAAYHALHHPDTRTPKWRCSLGGTFLVCIWVMATGLVLAVAWRAAFG